MHPALVQYGISLHGAHIVRGARNEDHAVQVLMLAANVLVRAAHSVLGTPVKAREAPRLFRCFAIFALGDAAKHFAAEVECAFPEVGAINEIIDV